MIREIRKKMVVLGNRSPFAPQTKDYINHLERVDWIHMNLLLDGSPLSRTDVESILSGEVILTGRIMDHVLIDRLDRLRSLIYSMESMGAGVNQDLASKFASVISDEKIMPSDFRKSTPTLQEFSYTPVLPSDIGQQLARLTAAIGNQGEFDDHFMKAALLHHGFMAIWPYRENNGIIARALMEYYLVKQGFPMVPLNMTESEYNSDFVGYIKTGSCSALADNLRRAVHDRLELMIQLTAY